MKIPAENSNNRVDQNNRQVKQLGIWTLSWILSLAAASLGPQFLWNFYKPLTILILCISILIGIKMILVNKQFLQSQDEMQRQIQLDAMALSIGVGLIIGSTYEILEDIKLIPFQPEISHLIIVMALAYVIGVIINQKKYQ